MVPLPLHEPLFMPPTTTDLIVFPTDQRTPLDFGTDLKDIYFPKLSLGKKKPRELRWITTFLTSEPTKDTVPKCSEWEARALFYVAIDMLTHNDTIRHSGFEG